MNCRKYNLPQLIENLQIFVSPIVTRLCHGMKRGSASYNAFPGRAWERGAKVNRFSLSYFGAGPIDFQISNFTALSVGILDDVLQCTTYSNSSLWPCEI